MEKKTTTTEGLVNEDIGLSRRTQQILTYVSGAVGLSSLMWIALFCPNPTAFQYTVFRIVLAISAASAIALVPGFIKIKLSKWLRAGGALAVFAIVYFLSPAQMLLPSKDDNAGKMESPIPPGKQKLEGKKSYKSLRELFSSDFPTCTKYSKPWKLTPLAPSHRKAIEITAAVIQDIANQAMYVAFFIPRNGGNSQRICMSLIDHVNEALDLNKEIRATIKTPGEAEMSNDKLRFTGRVFIYHEDGLSYQELADITNAFKRKDIDVQFRGPDYFQAKLLQDAAAK